MVQAATGGPHAKPFLSGTSMSICPKPAEKRLQETAKAVPGMNPTSKLASSLDPASRQHPESTSHPQNYIREMVPTVLSVQAGRHCLVQHQSNIRCPPPKIIPKICGKEPAVGQYYVLAPVHHNKQESNTINPTIPLTFLCQLPFLCLS